MSTFAELKEEILRRAKEARACEAQYKRAYQSEDMHSLCDVIKDNFDWCCGKHVLDAAIIEKYKEEFAENEIYCNISVTKGFLLCCNNATVEAYNNATVEAWGNATVKAYDNATVTAYDNATVTAYDNATVEAYNNATITAYDNATVTAYGNAYVTSYDVIECKLTENAIYRVRSTNEVRYASDDLRFVKYRKCNHKTKLL